MLAHVYGHFKCPCCNLIHAFKVVSDGDNILGVQDDSSDEILPIPNWPNPDESLAFDGGIDR